MYITKRSEIGEVMNFSKYPVLYIDIEERDRETGEPIIASYSKGCRVKVAWDHENPRYEGMTTRGNLYYEDGKYSISNRSACLSNEFRRKDILEDCGWARTPVVHKGQNVVVVEDYSISEKVAVRLMKVSDRIDIHCATVAYLEDV